MPVVGSQRVRCLAGASRGCMSADRTRDTCEGYYTIGQAKLIVLVEAPWLSYYYAALPGKRKQESGWRANAYPSCRISSDSLLLLLEDSISCRRRTVDHRAVYTLARRSSVIFNLLH